MSITIENAFHIANPEVECLESPVSEDLLETAIKMLNENSREAILAVCQYSYEEAASTLGCEIGTLRSRVHRAKVKIRENLSRLTGEQF